MFNSIQKFWQFITKPRVSYESLILARISKKALLNNLHYYQTTYPKVQFAPVLKSNAYGHGLTLVAGVLDEEDIPFLAVDSFYEALVLRQHGVKSKILIIGYSSFQQMQEKKLKNCAFSVINLQSLAELSENLTVPLTIHLKVDTGMHRQGITMDEVGKAIELIKKNPNISLEGVFSHLADADGVNDVYTNKQVDGWNKAVKNFRSSFASIKYFHLAATHGAPFSNLIDANLCRLGIGLYGYSASQNDHDMLLPALDVHSIISSIRDLAPGESIGYNITFTAKKPTKTATIPLGYNEGVDRRLSNKGCMLVKGIVCPIIGRVSMNITSIDVSAVPDVKVGDEVEVISAEVGKQNSVENIAKMCDTIPYDILVHVPQSIRRMLVE